MSWSMTLRTILTGIAKPMPMLPPVRDRMAELMPTSSPRRFTKAPPEFSGIDGSVGLDEILVAAGLRIDAAAPERADDTGGDGVLQAEGVADGDHVVADLELARIAEGHGDQIRLLCLQNRDIRAFVAADDFGAESAVVEQRDGDLAGVLDHVMIGDDVAVLRVDDDARSCALELALTRLRILRSVEESPEKRVVEERIVAGLFLDGPARGDVHHGGRDALDHGGQRRHGGAVGGWNTAAHGVNCR